MNGEEMDRRMHWLRLARELGQEDDFRALMDDLRREGAAAAKVEALETLAAEWRQSADEDERYLNRAHASEIHDVMASIRINREHADAVLAVLAGREVAP